MKQITKYFLKSCFVTIIDVAVVWIAHMTLKIDIVTANTIGVVVGFIIDYRISARFIFATAKGVGGFFVYFGTFLLGLIIADGMIYYGNAYLFSNFETQLRFLLSKGLSIGVPFFALYFIRKYIYHWIGKQKELR